MSGFGFPKSARILRRADFQQVGRRPGRRFETGNFLILIQANGRTISRLGITVTKKIGGAVSRNRLKRQVREFFRRNRRLLPKGYDVVIIARRGAPELDQAQIHEQLMILTQRPQT